MSYAWADEPYSNNYLGDFNTIQECIADAKDMGRKAETAIWIGRVEETGKPSNHTRRFTQCCM